MKRTPFIEQWSWQSPRLEITSIGLALAGLITSVILYQYFGPYSLFFLLLTILAVCYFCWYRWVAAKLKSIQCNSDKDVEIEGIVRKGIQAPGKIILGSDSIRFFNVLGLNEEITFDQLKPMRSKLFFNGQYMLGKRAIVFKGTTDLAIAVAKSHLSVIQEFGNYQTTKPAE